MFLGCQYSLYPMTSDFVGVILAAVKALDRYKGRLEVETDDISTTLIGAPEALFPALRESFLAAADASGHLVMNVSLSRGCPGEPDNPRCRSEVLSDRRTADEPDRVAAALRRLRPGAATGVPAAAQIALYPLGRAGYMDDVAGCIAFAKQAGVFAKGKHFCTKIAGDAADVFAAIEQSFLGFGDPDGHVVLTAIVSKGSPTAA
jgi:uncharacterized protein YqgV (UPF0045/DUF77 family)